MSGEVKSLSLAERMVIDAACDAFEATWRAAKRAEDSPSIIRHVRTALDSFGDKLRHDAQREVVRSLALLDLDYRWRRAESDASPDQLPRRPNLEDYSGIWPEWFDGPAAWPMAALAEEFRIRLNAQDQPRREEYRQRIAATSEAELDTLERVIDDVLAAFYPHELRLYARGQLLFVAPLPARLEIGRQRTGDGRPVSMSAKSGGMRLVIAEPAERSLSRSHARLEIGADSRLMLANLSEKNGISRRGEVSDHPQSLPAILPPGSLAIHDAPLLIGLGVWVVRISRC